MDEIRVLLLNVRGVLGDVIKAVLLACADLTVVGESLNVADVQALLERTSAEVVVCQLDDAAQADVANGLFNGIGGSR